jgi:hypothetical protein
MRARVIHRESLLNFQLLRHVFRDDCVTLQRRAVDARWHYSDEVPEVMTGFNPLRSTVYVARHSYLEKWLKHKEESVRRYNPPSNRLIHEVLFLVHDYLHVWAFNWIRKLAPALRVGERPITRDNIEDFVFCHLVTEAVATVGLDYWYMCALDADRLCPAGVDFEGLTVSYKLAHEHEYRRFSPGFDAQTPQFFEKIAVFYCTGEFTGFGKRDLYRSPVVYQWLSHELGYGERQRVYVRQWYSYLSRDDIRYTATELTSKVEASQPWKKRVVAETGRLLWDKVKNDAIHSPGLNIDPDGCWKSGKKALDYRFTNYNEVKKVDPGYRGDAGDADNFKYWLNQFIVQHDYDELDDEFLGILALLKDKRDPGLVRYLFKNRPRLRPEKGEPRDLFFLN